MTSRHDQSGKRSALEQDPVAGQQTNPSTARYSPSIGSEDARPVLRANARAASAENPGLLTAGCFPRKSDRLRDLANLECHNECQYQQDPMRNRNRHVTQTARVRYQDRRGRIPPVSASATGWKCWYWHGRSRCSLPLFEYRSSHCQSPREPPRRV